MTAQNSIRVGFVVLAPLAVALLNAMHPIVRQPVYEGIVASLNWWLVLHLLNLAGFPLLGWIAYLQVREIENWAAVVAKAAIAVFVPVYAAFDALAGVGTGTLVQQISCLQAAQVATFKLTVDAFWSSTPLVITAIVGSIAWMIAMLASAVALTASERRKRIAGLAVIVFFVGGWARSTFVSGDGSLIGMAWWIITVATAAAMLLLGKPGIPAALLTISGSLLSAHHIPPTGPVVMICLAGAAAYQELVIRGETLRGTNSASLNGV